MAEAAIIYFLRRLGYQLIQEGNVLSGVQDEIEWIKKEFQAMVAFLRDADKRQLRDETVAGWVKEDVLKNILFGVIASRGEPALDVMSAMDEGWLLERTNDYLQDKKYLLVLDDIWDENLWEELKHAFPRRKGRIIITTRIHVRKCGGLPLAIVAIGGLLSCKGRNSRVWQSVLDTLDWEFNHHRDIERLNKTLLFSYNHLPFYLKYCFLYPGLFPEAYEIGRKRLIRIFMIQAVTIHARDVVKACKSHDLMRDVANQMLKEERFGSILEEVNKTIQERQRKLVIYEDVDSIPSDINLQGTLINDLPKSVKNLRNLRTLDVRNTGVKHLPAGINELQHLRHLLLSSFRDRENGFLKMDGGGKHFVKLQTLSGIESDEDLVKQLRNLTSLRKLYIGKMTQANSGDFCQSLERMTKLRSLTVLKDPFPFLGKLPSLAILTLASSAYKNSIVNFPPGGFPKLKLLRILGMENWTTWMPIEKGSMPEIQFLLIADCPRLTSLPDGFNHLTSLDDLTFMGMSLVFAHKLQKRDKWKISHVKEVSIISEVNGQIVKEKLNTPHVN
ncbi:putative 40S ribosomal protein S4-like [Capsicum annuum]|nr:putative 40S ribosomal protein S4-like [Capsicum annuum]